MSYHTRFEITIQPPAWIKAVDLHAFMEKLDDDQADWSVSTKPDCILGTGESRWYSVERHKDMLAISKEFPQLLFTVTGHGEAADDIWREYFKAGKMQRADAQITFAPFNDEDAPL